MADECKPVAWQVRRTDGSPLACWEACTEDLYDATLATGLYSGYENGPPSEVRALYAAAPPPAVAPSADESPGFTTPNALLNDLLEETFWMGKGPNNHDSAMAWAQALERFLESTQPSAAGAAPTYTSTQATNCAGCGKHKHTPLRIDAMGGYVCLTCIDQKLGTLLGEFGYPDAAGAAEQAGAVARLPFAILPDELAALHRFHETTEDGQDYDVPVPMMKRLATIGLVRRVTGNQYEFTDFGISVCNGDFSDDALAAPGAALAAREQEAAAYLMTRPSGFAWALMPKDVTPAWREVCQADGVTITPLGPIASREEAPADPTQMVPVAYLVTNLPSGEPSLCFEDEKGDYGDDYYKPVFEALYLAPENGGDWGIDPPALARAIEKEKGNE